ncbi:hypothetical protein K438DRAFT_1972633 [Mycena galopus ATCC 62051]|nr:hypothetical protein K438DRAFT_1972633 [Mycena galopus ATCC 62051]
MRPMLDTSHRTPRTRTRRLPSPDSSHPCATRAVVSFPPRLRECVSAASVPTLLHASTSSLPFPASSLPLDDRRGEIIDIASTIPAGMDSITSLVYIGRGKRWRLTLPSPLPTPRAFLPAVPILPSSHPPQSSTPIANANANERTHSPAQTPRELNWRVVVTVGVGVRIIFIRPLCLRVRGAYPRHDAPHRVHCLGPVVRRARAVSPITRTSPARTPIDLESSHFTHPLRVTTSTSLPLSLPRSRLFLSSPPPRLSRPRLSVVRNGAQSLSFLRQEDVTNDSCAFEMLRGLTLDLLYARASF